MQWLTCPCDAHLIPEYRIQVPAVLDPSFPLSCTWRVSRKRRVSGFLPCLCKGRMEFPSPALGPGYREQPGNEAKAKRLRSANKIVLKPETHPPTQQRPGTSVGTLQLKPFRCLVRGLCIQVCTKGAACRLCSLFLAPKHRTLKIVGFITTEHSTMHSLPSS